MDEAYTLCDEIAIMDHGVIIAQGTPKDLLATHFNDVILQLPDNDIPKQLNLSFAIQRRKDIIEITTDDANKTIKELIDNGISLSHLQIRSRNLDDLFLELTGKALRS
jgi:ABC-2 type transport system ATP-binding protein